MRTECQLQKKHENKETAEKKQYSVNYFSSSTGMGHVGPNYNC